MGPLFRPYLYSYFANCYEHTVLVWITFHIRRTQMLLDRLDLGARTIGPFSALRHRLIVVIQEATMRQYRAYEFDNRDSAQVYQYMEARIEALKRRIEQLEAEKKALSGDLDCAYAA